MRSRSHIHVKYVYLLSYIYGSYSLELGEDIQLFCVVQDFCLVTVTAAHHANNFIDDQTY